MADDTSKENLVLIDADSIIYLIGPSLENLPLEPLGTIKLDEFLKSILKATYSKNYLGFFGGKGSNFRKAIAVTKPYKGNRSDDKPEWFKFWEPILKKHMEVVWGFQPCHNIEADDAVAIAAEKYRGDFNKVFIASPDKDLVQIPEVWFYNYDKRYTVFVDQSVADQSYCHQLIKGDATDNITGLFGAGDAVANKEVLRIQKLNLDRVGVIKEVQDFYVKWNTDILKEKLRKKQEKSYLDQYKIDNDISRLTAKLKSTALSGFRLDTSSLLTVKQSIVYFKEQKNLITLLTTEKQGKKHNFTLIKPIKDTRVKWSDIDEYNYELDNIDYDIDEDLLDSVI